MDTNTSLTRHAGILLHITSLPGNSLIGEMGQSAFDFIKWLHKAGMAYWQVLPLGHTGYGDSPYQCFSAFAGNPLLISLANLSKLGLLDAEQIVLSDSDDKNNVNYGRVYTQKMPLLNQAWQRFFKGDGDKSLHKEFDAFISDPDNAIWLEDYAMFMSLKESFNGQSWIEWPKPIRTRTKAALAEAADKLSERILYFKFLQFIFFRQWTAIKASCLENKIQIIGDLPIYVSYDSADTWANQQLFLLTKDGHPLQVAGVPPDYFSETGQLWGNPIYDWKKMAKDQYAWWKLRIKNCLKLYDYIRLDHFRGFFGYWSVRATAETAIDGKWVAGPGLAFFEALQKDFGENLPIIVEDLGEITSDIVSARKSLNLPGMSVLQFAWGTNSLEPLIPNPNSNYLPYQIEQNSIVYTGTHDNNTTRGWWDSAPKNEKTCLQVYLSVDGNCIHHDLIRCAFSTVAHTLIIPMQDLLGLGSEARMNMPGRSVGNWSWRVTQEQLSDNNAEWLYNLSLVYGRCNTPPEIAIKESCKEPEY